jgi:hypothetical protein
MQRVFSDERTLENGTAGLINMACLIRSRCMVAVVHAGLPFWPTNRKTSLQLGKSYSLGSSAPFQM